MKATDFRLNNLVIVNHKKDLISKIVWIQDESIHVDFERQPDLTNGIIISPEKIIGIEITEEWLSKGGFKEPKHAPENMKTWRGSMFLNNTPDGWLTIHLILCKGYVLVSVSETIDRKKSVIAELCRIKHIHQLQNLWFILTGQELEF